MTIRPLGAELFHTDARTDIKTDGHDVANNRFLQSENAPKMTRECFGA